MNTKLYRQTTTTSQNTSSGNQWKYQKNVHCQPTALNEQFAEREKPTGILKTNAKRPRVHLLRLLWLPLLVSSPYLNLNWSENTDLSENKMALLSLHLSRSLQWRWRRGEMSWLFRCPKTSVLILADFTPHKAPSSIDTRTDHQTKREEDEWKQHQTTSWFSQEVIMWSSQGFQH